MAEDKNNQDVLSAEDSEFDLDQYPADVLEIVLRILKVQHKITTGKQS